jgi:LysM repeat protein
MGVSPLGPGFKLGQAFGSNPTRNNPHPTFGDYQPNGHTGHDYPAPTGTPVYATEDGVVTWVGPGASLPGDDSHEGWASRYYLEKWGAGNLVAIQHDALGGYVTLTYHLHGFAPGLKNFDRVKRGQLIGYVGSTGRSTGPHAHLDVIPSNPFNWTNGLYGRVDPTPYVSDPWPGEPSAPPSSGKEPGLMTSLVYLTQHNATAYTPAAAVRAVFGVARPAMPVSDVLHWWDDPARRPTFEGTVRWFETQPRGGVSAHYVVEAGRVATMVNEADASHANGHGGANAMTVTHECNPRASQADFEAIAEHLANCWIGRGRTTPGLIELHSDYLATACPGTYRDRLAWIRTRSAELFSAKRRGVEPSKPAPAPVPVPTPLPPASWDGEKLPANGVHVAKPGDTVRGIAKRYGRTVGQLVAWNRYITNPAYLRVGDRVRVSMPEKPAADVVRVAVRGDSLKSIAALYGTTVPALVARNRYITNPNYLAVGDRVAIPQSNDAVHVAVKGDNPGKVAARYGTTLATVLDLNPYIKDPNYLAVGDRVRVSR